MPAFGLLKTIGFAIQLIGLLKWPIDPLPDLTLYRRKRVGKWSNVREHGRIVAVGHFRMPSLQILTSVLSTLGPLRTPPPAVSPLLVVVLLRTRVNILGLNVRERTVLFILEIEEQCLLTQLLTKTVARQLLSPVRGDALSAIVSTRPDGPNFVPIRVPPMNVLPARALRAALDPDIMTNRERVRLIEVRIVVVLLGLMPSTNPVLTPNAPPVPV